MGFVDWVSNWNWEWICWNCWNIPEWRYSKMLEHTQLSISFNLHFELLSVFIKYFVDLWNRNWFYFFRNALKYLAIQSDTKSFIILNTVTSLLVEDGGTDTALKQLFIDHPSLVSDIHTLIDVVDAKYSDNSSVSVWLMCLIGSPRTKEVWLTFSGSRANYSTEIWPILDEFL